MQFSVFALPKKIGCFSKEKHRCQTDSFYILSNIVNYVNCFYTNFSEIIRNFLP